MSVALGGSHLTSPDTWFRSANPYKALWDAWWAAITMDGAVLVRGGGGTLLVIIATLTSWMCKSQTATDSTNARLRDVVNFVTSVYNGST
jgi:hypothetical protein